MTAFDLIATAPAILTGIALCVWLIRNGDKRSQDRLRLYCQLFLGTAGIASWSCVADAIAGSPWERWFVHLVMDYVLVGTGVMTSFVVSLTRPVRRA